MLNLPNVMIVSINCVNAIEGVKAIHYSMRHINFKKAILFTHEDIIADDITVIKIPKLNSVDEYNDKVLRLTEMLLPVVGLDYDFMLLCQEDGFVQNAGMWQPEFLNYDFLGAPWPNDPDWIEKQTKVNNHMVGDWNRVGNGGFSLRSKKFMQYSSTFQSCQGLGEDIFLCTVNFEKANSLGLKFAPVELALKFSYENPVSEMGHKWNDRVNLNINEHFGFHGHNFVNSPELINLKNK